MNSSEMALSAEPTKQQLTLAIDIGWRVVWQHIEMDVTYKINGYDQGLIKLKLKLKIFS